MTDEALFAELMRLIAEHGWEEWSSMKDYADTAPHRENLRPAWTAVRPGENYLYEITKSQAAQGMAAFTYPRGPLHNYWGSVVQVDLIGLMEKQGHSRVAAAYQKIINLLGRPDMGPVGPTGPTGSQGPVGSTN